MAKLSRDINFDDNDEALMVAILLKEDAIASIEGSDKRHPPFNMTDSYTLKGLSEVVIRLLSHDN